MLGCFLCEDPIRDKQLLKSICTCRNRVQGAGGGPVLRCCSVVTGPASCSPNSAARCFFFSKSHYNLPKKLGLSNSFQDLPICQELILILHAYYSVLQYYVLLLPWEARAACWRVTGPHWEGGQPSPNPGCWTSHCGLGVENPQTRARVVPLLPSVAASGGFWSLSSCDPWSQRSKGVFLGPEGLT